MPFCRFCFDNKIDGPHNHYLRESKDSSSRLTCPLLLNTLCLKCNKKGHTTNYCRVKTKTSEVNTAREYDEDGFIIIKSKNQKSNKEENKYIENKNNFAILCEDNINEEPVKSEEKFKPLLSKRPVGMSWADWEELDD